MRGNFYEKEVFKLQRGGGNRLASHINGFSLVRVFNNLAPWGENKFVSEQERTYKFKRGVYCHTEDNSPKYRMVGEILSILRSFAVQTRIFAKECNIIAVGYVRSTAQDDENLNRLRNKCAMTDYGHAELVSASCGLNPSPAFQAPSPQVARGKIRSFGNMKENIFLNTVHSLFITHHSLINNDTDFSRFTSHFSQKRIAFTLAEVLVTLGIIGVVSAMTVPTLMQNYQRQSYVTQLHKVYNEVQQATLRKLTDTNAINLIEAGLTTTDSMKTFLHDYFKVVQDCDNGVAAPCFVSDYKNLNGGSFTSINGNKWTAGACVSLASGASICMDRPNWFTITYNGVAQTAGNVFVDINGRKGPNIVGRDAFYMAIFTDGVLDTGNVTPICRTQGVCNGGSIENARLSGNACENSTTTSDYACFGKILNANWQMEY